MNKDFGLQDCFMSKLLHTIIFSSKMNSIILMLFYFGNCDDAFDKKSVSVKMQIEPVSGWCRLDLSQQRS